MFLVCDSINQPGPRHPLIIPTYSLTILLSELNIYSILTNECPTILCMVGRLDFPLIFLNQFALAFLLFQLSIILGWVKSFAIF